MYRKSRAFTLIELLIVVAIIAILAAIAVPNFLEAQVRAKVAKVKADQRSLATACESYYIDWNRYPHNNASNDTTNNAQDRLILPLLSTPVGYIASSWIPDPFGNRYSSFSGEQDVISYNNISSADFLASAAVALAVGNGDITPRRARKLFDQGFFLGSVGPDREGRPAQIALENGNDPSNPLFTDFADWLAEVAGTPIIYDPSNGTISNGDILRSRHGVLTTFKLGIGGL